MLQFSMSRLISEHSGLTIMLVTGREGTVPIASSTIMDSRQPMESSRMR